MIPWHRSTFAALKYLKLSTLLMCSSWCVLKTKARNTVSQTLIFFSDSKTHATDCISCVDGHSILKGIDAEVTQIYRMALPQCDFHYKHIRKLSILLCLFQLALSTLCWQNIAILCTLQNSKIARKSECGASLMCLDWTAIANLAQTRRVKSRSLCHAHYCYSY